MLFLFFLHAPATSEIYTLSLHDALPISDVKLSNQGTGATQVTQTDNSGLFVFPSVQPGTFAISVQAGGFKSFEKRDLHLRDRKSTRLNSSHVEISYAVFCLKKKNLIPRR